MKSWITQLAAGAFALVALSFSSCKKDEERTVIAAATAPTLTASTATPNLALTTANSGTAAVTFNYTAADFGYPAGVTYVLQFDKKGGNFTSPVTFSVGTAAGSFSLTTAQLVNVYTSLGYAFNSASQVDARVIASVGAAAATQNSKVVTLTGTPTPLCITNTFGDWGIVGPAADGWPGATNTDRVMTYDCYTQTFSLRTTLTAGVFKFRANKDWTTNLGGTATTYSTGVPLTLNGGDLNVTTPGTYTVTLAITTDAKGVINGGNVTLKP